MRLVLALAVISLWAGQASAQEHLVNGKPPLLLRRITNAERRAAAVKAAEALKMGVRPFKSPMRAPLPGGIPNYFGPEPNYANSPQPTVISGVVTGGGIRKFVDSLPGLGAGNANNLGQYIPVAVPNTAAFPGSDYYQIGLKDYTEKMHSDLPATKLRGYYDIGGGSPSQYLGPFIIAQKNRPVRIKFTNQLGLGTAGNLFVPVDETTMGAGMGPDGMNKYTQNRAVLHLHGGDTPWISDGTPHQWITPAGEATPYTKGASQQNVPDMPSPGPGSATYYYPNGQSARMMFYHDHSYGTTRLNVYAGSAAGYLLTDPTEDGLINSGLLPNIGGNYRYGIPLIIQDKTFVSAPDIPAQDPTWNWGSTPGTARTGDLWFPHVYMPNQNPLDISGANPMGRWDYGPWFWPPLTAAAGLIHDANPDGTPATPNPTMVPESFLDTPVVNGTPYPYLNVQRRAYRFRILNASNDRFWNLQLYYADPAHPTEVQMVNAVKVSTFPATWPTDGREGGVPDPTFAGPPIIQIGTEGGFLTAPVVIPNQPINYNYNRRDIVVLNISDHGLLLGPAERADIIVDFSNVPSTVTNLILYNDAPAPVPAFDTRNDYYTGGPDQTDTGGSTTTMAGYGPNTRTILQFRLSGPAFPSFSLPALTAAWPAAYSAAQPALTVPSGLYSRIQSTALTFSTAAGSAAIVNPLLPKAIQELFELNYGRMNATLGVELPLTNFNTQTTIPYGYTDPPTEFFKPGELQLWKITHNGVDTHAIHFHLFNVQLVNRVGWDGAIRPPDANELGWKETVRMNPLEDAIVALKIKDPVVPFALPESVRSLDVTQPPTATLSSIDPLTNSAYTLSNAPMYFGHEYVWHCHLLGHEEHDMMRPMILLAMPLAPVVTAVPGNASATVSFPTLQTGGLIVTTYTVTNLRTGGATVLSNVSPVIFTGLTNGATYQFSVTVTNPVGTGPAGLSNIIIPGTVPSAPRNVVAVAGNGQATISFSPPLSNGFNPILYYTVTSGTFTVTGTGSPITVTGLVNGTEYTFTVTATNAIGTGPGAASLAVTPKVPPVTLAAPSGLRATTTASTYVTLGWTSNAPTATGFQIQQSNNGGVTWTTIATTTNLTAAYRVNGLVTKTRYLFRVRAYLGLTYSPYSSTLSVTTL